MRDRLPILWEGGTPHPSVPHSAKRPGSLTLSGNHVETIQFYVLHAPTAPLVLGHPWLDKHDPYVAWSSGRILGWSVACHANCLRSALSLSSGTKPSVPPPSLAGIPSAYHDLAPVFSKESALSLPPHHPYDCAIDLLPLYLWGDFTTCLSPRRRRCAIISPSPWPRASYSRPPLPLQRGFSSCPRRTAA